MAFLLFVGGIHWYQRYQISVIYARWRAEGLPTNQEELANYYRPPIKGTDNSVLWLPAIEKASQLDFITWSITDEGEEATRINLSDEVLPAAGQPWGNREEVEEFLIDVTPELQSLYHAAEAGGQAKFTAFVPSNVRSAAQLLWLESRTARYVQNTPRRLQAIRALLALSNIGEGSPDVIMALTFFAISTVSHTDVVDFLSEGIAEDQHLAELQKLVCQVDYLEVCRTGRSEEFINCVDDISEQSRSPFTTVNELDILRRLELSRPAYAKPWPEMLSELSCFSDRMQVLLANRWQNSIRFQTSKPEDVFDSLRFIKSFAVTMAHIRARQSSVNALLAAERHRLRHGSYPAMLFAIDADLIGKGRDGSISLSDPFTGKPLCYRLTDTELRIYSVGENQQDDGGNFESAPEKGLFDFGYSVKRK